MKWVLVALGALLGLVALAFVVGALLPREHRATRSVVLRQPPETVWAVVRDLGGLAAWWPYVRHSERAADPAGRELVTQTGPHGDVMRLVVVESRAPAHLVTEIVAAPGAPFGGRWLYELAPANGGTRVTITEDGWISNPVFRLVANLMGLGATLEDYLRALGRRFGETVTPTAP